MNNKQATPPTDNQRDLIETLAAAAKEQDKFSFVELIGIFSPYIASLARSFKLPESEFDDLCQVGRIALFRAINTYDGSRSSFTTFARVCIRNAMTSLVRTYSADNRFAANSVSLDDIQNTVPAPNNAPEDRYLASELMRELENALQNALSPTERKVLTYRLSGIGVPEIAVMLGKGTKSVENTLFRARKKLRTALRSE